MMKLIHTFEHFMFEKLMESLNGEVSIITQEVQDVIDELGENGAEDDELKAAILLQAIDNDGEIEEIDVDRLKSDVAEGMEMRGKSLNESLAGIFHVLEVMGNVMGNMGLIEFICEKIEKATGKKPDAGKVKETMEKVLNVIKKVTGLPARAIEKFFEFIGQKAGLSHGGTKGLELVGMATVIVFFMTLGIMHFPVLGSSLLMGLLSLTGLIGKSTELVRIGKEIVFLISNADSAEAHEEIEGVSLDELAKMAGA